MDKRRKLRRYQRKDYSEIVDFPVEIVGRDGAVRRYSFEASVRLYQRRIASAPSRYEDEDLVRAEVEHCRRRIGQLRVSYLQRYGWDGLGQPEELHAMAGELGGEVVAFIRQLVQDPAALAATRVDLLEDAEGLRILAVQTRDIEDQPRTLLLYLYRFDTPHLREAFFQRLAEARQARGPEQEHLVAFRHSADCGLVLTGPEGAAAGFPEPAEPPLPEGPVEEARTALGQGDAEGALRRIEDHLVRAPYDREGYRVGLAASAELGRPEQVEALARLALHYFPDDLEFRAWLAVSCFQQGDQATAREMLEELVGHARFGGLAQALLAVTERRPLRRLVRLGAARGADLAANPDLRKLVEAMWRRDREVLAGVLISSASLLTALLLLPVGGWPWLCLAVLWPPLVLPRRLRALDAAMLERFRRMQRIRVRFPQVQSSRAGLH